MRWRVLFMLFCLISVLSTPACLRPHKAPVSQGNLLRDEDIERLQIGMTKEQVVFLIGQPILAQPFAKARWDYIYAAYIGYRDPIRKNLILYFEDDKLVRIDNQYSAEGEEDEDSTNEGDDKDSAEESDNGD